MMSHLPHEDNSQRILIVDDVQGTQRMIALQLERAGFAVVTAGSGARALELVRRQGLPRLALLDLNMPGMSGLAVADALRAIGDVPIIFLWPPSEATPFTGSAPRNAEDVLMKPFAFGELYESVQRALARAATPPVADQEAVIDARLRVNFAQQLLLIGDRTVTLTPTETRLLHLLYCHRGRVVSPGYLVSKAWDGEQRGTLGSLWVHIRRLRNKLEPNPEVPRYLLTVRGQGYTLQVDSRLSQPGH